MLQGYYAPELVSRDPFGVAVDVWSLGVVLFILLSKTYPFAPTTDPRRTNYVLQFPSSNWSTKSHECVPTFQECCSCALFENACTGYVFMPDSAVGYLAVGL